MNVAIDKAGRVVVPQPIRQQLNLTAGSILELELESDRIVLRPRGFTPALKEINGLLLHEGEPTADLLTAVEEQRRARSRSVSGMS